MCPKKLHYYTRRVTCGYTCFVYSTINLPVADHFLQKLDSYVTCMMFIDDRYVIYLVSVDADIDDKQVVYFGLKIF